MEAILRHRHECEQKALNIVIRLLEPDIDADFFSNAGSFITSSHYRDIIEERAILKLCGYPLCSSQLPQMPKQRYHISTKSNKVFDLTERKSFCSNHCYEVSKHYESQLSPVPLDSRKDITKRPLLLLSLDTTHGKTGQEIIGGAVEADQTTVYEGGETSENKKDLDRSTFISDANGKVENGREHLAVNMNEECAKEWDIKIVEKVPEVVYPDDGLKERVFVDKDESEILKEKLSAEKNTEKSEKVSSSDNTRGIDSLVETMDAVKVAADVKVGGQGIREKQSKVDYLMKLLETRKGKLAKMANITSNVTKKEKVESGMKKKDVRVSGDSTTKLVQRNVNTEKNIAPSGNRIVDSADSVYTVILSWRTQFTLKYLGLGSVGRSTEFDAPKSGENTDCICGTESTVENCLIKREGGYDRHKTGRLAVGRLNSDPQDCLDEVKHGGQQHAIPHDDSRKTENSEDIRVSVSNICSEPVKTAECEAELLQFRIYESKVKEFYRRYVKDNNTVEDEEPKYVVPLVDSQSQMVIRRRIVLERLDKALRGLLGPLNLTIQEVTPLLREFVATFHLTNTTVTFKPAQWSHVCIVLLHILGRKFPMITQALERPTSINYLNTLLSSRSSGLHLFVETFIEM